MNLRNKFKAVLSRKTNNDVTCGWTLERILALPQAEQEYLLQFFLESSGSLSHKQSYLLSPDEIRTAWREQKKRLLRVKREEIGLPADYQNRSSTLSPEDYLIFFESNKNKKTRC